MYTVSESKARVRKDQGAVLNLIADGEIVDPKPDCFEVEVMKSL